MPKFVIVVTFYFMHKKNEGTLVPLEFYKYVMIFSWCKIFSKCRSSLIFSSLLLVFLLDRLLVLLLVSLILTLVVVIVYYKFLGFFFVVFTNIQTRLTLLKSNTRFIQW